MDSTMPPIPPKPSSPSSPANKPQNAFKFPSSPSSRNIEENTLLKHIQDLKQWNSPLNSSVALITVIGIYYMIRGTEGYSVVSLACYSVIARLVSVATLRRVARFFNSREALHRFGVIVEHLILIIEEWFIIPTAPQVRVLVQNIAFVVEHMMTKLCALLIRATEASSDGTKALKKVFLSLFLMKLILRYMELETIIFCIALQQLTWPPFYAAQKERVDMVWQKFDEILDPYIIVAKSKAGEVYKIGEEKAHQIGQVLAQKLESLVNSVLGKPKQPLMPPKPSNPIKQNESAK